LMLFYECFCSILLSIELLLQDIGISLNKLVFYCILESFSINQLYFQGFNIFVLTHLHFFKVFVSTNHLINLLCGILQFLLKKILLKFVANKSIVFVIFKFMFTNHSQSNVLFGNSHLLIVENPSNI